jgi:hypothetical protein
VDALSAPRAEFLIAAHLLAPREGDTAWRRKVRLGPWRSSCWKVTGTAGTEKLTFVVQVIRADGAREPWAVVGARPLALAALP